MGVAQPDALCRDANIHALENAVQLTFKNPTKDFDKSVGYVLVNVPWLAKAEWHAFSIFRHPTLPDHSCVCMNVGGDWTRALHEKTKVPTCRPCWVSGPFASPYSTAINYDNRASAGLGPTTSRPDIAAWPSPSPHP